MIYRYIQFAVSERGILLPSHGSKHFIEQTIWSSCSRNTFYWSWSLSSLRYVVTCSSQIFLTKTIIKIHTDIVLFNSVLYDIMQTFLNDTKVKIIRIIGEYYVKRFE